MNRIPYLPADLADPQPLVDAIRKRRGGALIELDRMLLHSPPLAAGWNTMMGAVRTDLELPARLRELAMCVVAVVNQAEYEFFHHAPLLKAAGASQAQVDALRDPDRAAADTELFDAHDRAVIALVIELTRHARVSDETFAAARSSLPNDRQIVELVGVTAAYNMVSRFLNAMGIEPT